MKYVTDNVPSNLFTAVRSCYCSEQKILTRTDDGAALWKFFVIYIIRKLQLRGNNTVSVGTLELLRGRAPVQLRGNIAYSPRRSVKIEYLDTGEVIAKDRRQRKTLDGLKWHGARNACQEAKQRMLQYKNYFMNEGQGTWHHKFLWLIISSLQKSAINYSITVCFPQIYQ
jgi:hypothetical protein